MTTHRTPGDAPSPAACGHPATTEQCKLCGLGIEGWQSETFEAYALRSETDRLRGGLILTLERVVGAEGALARACPTGSREFRVHIPATFAESLPRDTLRVRIRWVWDDPRMTPEVVEIAPVVVRYASAVAKPSPPPVLSGAEAPAPVAPPSARHREVRIEADVTPRWWSEQDGERIGRAIAEAVRVAAVQEVRASRQALVLLLSPSMGDVTLDHVDALRQRVADVIQRVGAKASESGPSSYPKVGARL